MKTTKTITRAAPALPSVPSAPMMAASLATAVARLLTLADGAAAMAADAVKAGRHGEAIRRLDQASDALSLARRAGAEVTDRRATLAKLRAVVEGLEELSA